MDGAEEMAQAMGLQKCFQAGAQIAADYSELESLPVPALKHRLESGQGRGGLGFAARQLGIGLELLMVELTAQPKDRRMAALSVSSMVSWKVSWKVQSLAEKKVHLWGLMSVVARVRL